VPPVPSAGEFPKQCRAGLKIQDKMFVLKIFYSASAMQTAAKFRQISCYWRYEGSEGLKDKIFSNMSKRAADIP
jgi:flagellar motor switch protein FliG